MIDRQTEPHPRADLLPPLDEYNEVQPLLRHVRIMERFFDEVVDENPDFRKHYPDLHGAYMNILAEELAPHALSLALAVTELEDAYPEIKRREPAVSGDRPHDRGAGRAAISNLPKVETVPVVTTEHGAAFAQAWYEGDMVEACAETEIMTWPETDREAQSHYHDLENEICAEVFEATKQQIANAFVRVANIVLDRERR